MATNKNRDMVAMHSLANVAIDAIFQAENYKEVLQSLWKMKEFIPTTIRKKTKTNSCDDLLYSFNRDILREIWGCPEEYLDEYADSSDLDDLLDDIIYGKPIDILNVPVPILELLDRRDQEICNSDRYVNRFVMRKNGEAFSTRSGHLYQWMDDEWCAEQTEIVRIAETEDEGDSWILPTNTLPHRPVYRCGCGSKYFENECHCYVNKNCNCDSWYTGFNCVCGADDTHEFRPSEM